MNNFARFCFAFILLFAAGALADPSNLPQLMHLDLSTENPGQIQSQVAQILKGPNLRPSRREFKRLAPIGYIFHFRIVRQNLPWLFQQLAPLGQLAFNSYSRSRASSNKVNVFLRVFKPTKINHPDLMIVFQNAPNQHHWEKDLPKRLANVGAKHIHQITKNSRTHIIFDLPRTQLEAWLNSELAFGPIELRYYGDQGEDQFHVVQFLRSNPSQKSQSNQVTVDIMQPDKLPTALQSPELASSGSVQISPEGWSLADIDKLLGAGNLQIQSPGDLSESWTLQLNCYLNCEPNPPTTSAAATTAAPEQKHFHIQYLNERLEVAGGAVATVNNIVSFISAQSDTWFDMNGLKTGLQLQLLSLLPGDLGFGSFQDVGISPHWTVAEFWGGQLNAGPMINLLSDSKINQLSGLGAEADYVAPSPHFFNYLVDWLPILNRPKEVALTADYVPFALSGNSISITSLNLAERLYVFPKFYISPQVEYLDGNGKNSKGTFNVSILLFELGLGAQF